jgi:hypothetical protein
MDPLTLAVLGGLAVLALGQKKPAPAQQPAPTPQPEKNVQADIAKTFEDISKRLPEIVTAGAGIVTLVTGGSTAAAGTTTLAAGGASAASGGSASTGGVAATAAVGSLAVPVALIAAGLITVAIIIFGIVGGEAIERRKLLIAKIRGALAARDYKLAWQRTVEAANEGIGGLGWRTNDPAAIPESIKLKDGTEVDTYRLVKNAYAISENVGDMYAAAIQGGSYKDPVTLELKTVDPLSSPAPWLAPGTIIKNLSPRWREQPVEEAVIKYHSENQWLDEKLDAQVLKDAWTIQQERQIRAADRAAGILPTEAQAKKGGSAMNE